MATQRSWRDQLQPASFRGVPFYVDSSNEVFGPNILVREYPFSSLPDFEYTSRRAHSISFAAYVMGEQYMDARDALIKALEKPETGELVHSWRGLFSVVFNGEIRLTETKQQGGVARFELTFVKAANQEPQAPRPSAKGQLQAAVKIADQANQSAFADAFDASSSAAFVVQDAAAKLDTVTTAIETAGTAVVDGTLDSPFMQALTELNTQGRQLLAQPQRLAGQLVTVVAAITQESTDFAVNLVALKTLFNIDVTDPGIQPTTARRVQQIANQKALSFTLQMAATTAAVAAVAEQPFTWYRQAEQYRQTLNQQLKKLRGQAPNASIKNSLQELQTRLQWAIAEQTQTLARLRGHTPARTLPAAVLSQQLYGQGNRGAEIARHNGILNPLFVPGGQPIEVEVSSA